MALRELPHSNIVQLVDAGTEESSGRLFVVTEWVEHSLPEWLKAHPLAGWDDYYERIGKGLLDALHFAHLRRFTHRDVKPAKVLMTGRGVPKLADFGLAKLHAFMQPGVTLSECASRPFAPPEADEGVHAFERRATFFSRRRRHRQAASGTQIRSVTNRIAGIEITHSRASNMTNGGGMTIITVRQNGPYLVEGNDVTLVDWNGKGYRPVNRARFALCRCGASTSKPFCDGTHSRVDCQAAEAAAPGSENKQAK